MTAADQDVGVRVGATRPEPAEPAHGQTRRSAGGVAWAGMLAVAAVALAADEIVKAIVSRSVELGDSYRLGPVVSLTHVHNSGIAFGRFQGIAELVGVLTVGAIAWILWWFGKNGGRRAWFPAAVGLLVGGALGNLIDRIRQGYVVDYVDLHWWPVFNLADSFIVIGVGLLLLGAFLHDRDGR